MEQNKVLTYEEEKALQLRINLGVSVIREDAWKYARQDKALQEYFSKKIISILGY